MKFVSKLAVVAAALAAVPASAGTLIVAGDATIASRTVSAAANPANTALAGNLTFAQNILGGGDSVSLYRYSVITTYPNPPLGEQLAGVYAGLGHTTSLFDNTISAATLAGADLLVILGRENAYSANETSLIRDFLYGGGNVLLAGEASNIGTTANNVTNALLAELGSTLRITGALDSPGDQFATGSQILANDLTAGITSFGYGYTSRVTGGSALFRNSVGNTFVAAESIAAPVPEPATWAMMIAGFGLVGGAMRRRADRIAFA